MASQSNVQDNQKKSQFNSRYIKMAILSQCLCVEFPDDWILQVDGTPGRYDGQSVVPVVVNEVADAVKLFVFCPHL